MNEGTRLGKSTIRLLDVSAVRPTNGLNYIRMIKWEMGGKGIRISHMVLEENLKGQINYKNYGHMK
jgi:hypothetical protein